MVTAQPGVQALSRATGAARPPGPVSYAGFPEAAFDHADDVPATGVRGGVVLTKHVKPVVWLKAGHGLRHGHFPCARRHTLAEGK
ncbi:hypothetical protein GCM10010357_11880 [Streptomyces luteireticuli]|uniref:Uncharacterized protein n=1 Tax=Streptomyces luteireticuli TaxID=173858 RepID=A0ABN0YEA6_9ACTN